MQKTEETKNTGERVAGLSAGISLLVMAIVAGISFFGVINNAIVAGDASATAARIVANEGSIRVAALSLFGVVILDVIVAWGLYIVLREKNDGLALLGAWFRLVYSALFAVAIAYIFDAVRAAQGDPAEALALMESFDARWQAALVVFGFHLAIVGSLVWRGGWIVRVLAVLVVIAGVGYVVDGVVILLNPTFTAVISTYTFVGEVLLIVWLLGWAGRKRA